MNLEKLSDEIRRHAKKILAEEVEAEYEKIDRDYIGTFCRENKIDENFTLLSLQMPDGGSSGLATCSKCTEKLKEKSKTKMKFFNILLILQL